MDGGGRQGAPELRFGERCHPGLQRAENQDAIAHASTPQGELFVVSDGVGGNYGGAEASRIVTQTILNSFHVHGHLGRSVEQANAAVYSTGQAGDELFRHMAATAVVALLQVASIRGGMSALIASVGDSRAYLVRRGRLVQLSKDDTVAQTMVDAGTLTPDQARTDPRAHILTRAMGQTEAIEVAVETVPLQAGDQILLCSDGLHGYATPREIVSVMRDAALTPDARAAALIDIALDAGGPDNVSVQVIEVGGLAKQAAFRSTWLRWTVYATVVILLALVAAVIFYTAFRSQHDRPGSTSRGSASGSSLRSQRRPGPSSNR